MLRLWTWAAGQEVLAELDGLGNEGDLVARPGRGPRGRARRKCVETGQARFGNPSLNPFPGY